MAPEITSRCSVAFRERGEPLLGSAPVARRWLLIEHPGPWAKLPLETPPIAGRAAEAIDAACEARQARPLLLRRTGRRAPGEGHKWYAVDCITGMWVTGSWSSTDDLIAAADALGAPLAQSEVPAEPMLLVCTHGTRDACCALRGRPTAGALAREWPDEVWECTHLGGHRFSGTFLSMPDGTCYGGIDQPVAVSVVRKHRAGEVEVPHLRGLSRHPPAVQAATGLVLRDHGPAPIDAARPGAIEQVSDRVTRIEVIGDEPLPETTWVEVTESDLPPAPLSCGKSPGEHTAYVPVVIPSPY